VRSSFEYQSGLGESRALLAAVASLAMAALSPALGQSPTPTVHESLQGRLTVVQGSQPTLKTAKRDFTLSAKNSYLSHTLHDERLLNREIRVDGSPKPDCTFEVAHLFTVRDGKLYKVRYYCDICNIVAQDPGNCVCCQRPTELQEIPLGEVGNDTVVVP
jgi:hypothetical protein